MGSFQISLDLVARPFIHDLAPHRIADVGHAVASRRQSAPYAVNTFTEDDLDRFNVLAEYGNVQRLPGCGDPNRDSLVVHTVADGVLWLVSMGAVWRTKLSGMAEILKKAMEQRCRNSSSPVA